MVEATLLLAVLFGAPVLVLALAVGYHARLCLLDRRDASAAAPSDADPSIDGPPTEGFLELRRSLDDLHDQLSRQRDVLSKLLSGSAHQAAQRELRQAPPTPPRVAETRAPAAALPGRVFAGGDLSRNVSQLTAEGLSDRAIARRLRIGLEAVRLMARRRPAPSS